MNSGMGPVLQVYNLSKRFTLHLRGGLQLPVLDGLSFTVNAGECVALVGPSGRGKSTVMKCLYGSYAASSGELWFTPRARSRIDLAKASAQEWIALRRTDIAYVSQFLRVLPRVPTLDVVAHAWLDAQPTTALDDDIAIGEAHQAALGQARQHAADLLARLHIPKALWALPPATFSGGEQQRVNIARGWMQPARLLLLDEPTASLDAVNRGVVVDLIREAKIAGCAVVGIFHDEEVRAAVAERCIAFP
jgi:alpha-D-ribose 1-methylphosphonate 5-triphosphate synthase subunit PhnL